MKSNKKIILAGGTGFLGQAFQKHFSERGDDVIVFTRGSNRSTGKTKFIHWDGRSGGTWQQELEGADVLINLTGKNVNCRYTEKNKTEIIASRVDSTKILGETILKLKRAPELWINLASATIYPHSEKTPMTEADTEFENDFSAQVCKRWENSFYSFDLSATRRVCLRVAMIFGNGGGVFPVLKNLVRFGLGGKMGKGNQMVSWMDEVDFLAMVQWAIDNKSVSGTYNCTAPQPLTNTRLMQLLRKEMKVPIGLPASAFLLGIGSFIIRTEPELVLKSRYVIPEKAVKEGFRFSFPSAEQSIRHLITQ